MQLALILILALAVRLIHVNAPIIGYHAWRQADTAAMARNFHESGHAPFFPQVDWGGPAGAFVECELPLYPYVTSLAYGVFGFSELAGRLLSVLCALAAICGLYALVRSTIDERTALWSALIYALLPLNIYYGRAFMPESALLMSLVLGLLFFRKWLDSGGVGVFVFATVFTSLAALLKLPSLYVGLPLLFLAWRRYGAGLFRVKSLWLFAVLVLAPVALWYHHAHQLYLGGGVSFGIWEYGSDKWGNWSLVFGAKFWNRILLQWLAERHLTYVGFLLFGIGLALPRRSNDERLFDVWLLAILAYVVIVARGNFVHEYYLLPAVLPASVFLGKVFARHLHVPPRDARSVALAIGLIGILGLSVARLSTYLKAEDASASAHLALAEQIQERTKPGEAVILVDLADPTLMYLSHRKGWHAFPDGLTPEFVRELRRAGARYVAGWTHEFDTETRRASLHGVLALGELLTAPDAEGFLLRLDDEPAE